jgi:hypothetical protein
MIAGSKSSDAVVGYCFPLYGADVPSRYVGLS